jgi:SAM-dependent methyltransferase
MTAVKAAPPGKPLILPRQDDAAPNLDHRGEPAASWNAIGQLQLDYLLSAGLLSTHKLLDLGCGALRTGAKLIPYLEPANYYGIDADVRRLDAGYNQELGQLGLRKRSPRKNLFHSPMFNHGRLENGSIDVGICFSVLPELPPHYIRILLERSYRYFKADAELHVSYLELPASQPYSIAYTNMSRFVTQGKEAPFHYYRRTMEIAAEGLGWQALHVGMWDHPNGESMIVYKKKA